VRIFVKFISYYKPYKHIFLLDLFCAFVASVVVLAYPVMIRNITTDALSRAPSEAIAMIIRIAALFVFLVAIEYVCNYFISYVGHLGGAKMEFDMRNDLFNHYQKLSFSYYDNARTGQLMSRITNDLFDVTELAHHGPEDVLISVVKIIGSFIILSGTNLILTLMIFAILPFMVLFSVYYNKKMHKAFRRNRERIAEINAQIEDSLSGIRAVKSFANEDLEVHKFIEGNRRFVDSKRDSYQNMAKHHSGITAFTSFINLFVVVAGALFIIRGQIVVTDLLTYLLYVNTLIEPVRRLMNFTEQFQNGATGFIRFNEIMDTEPDIQDTAEACDVSGVSGKIEFVDVDFKYSAETVTVLEDLSFTADPGDYIALVGSSGVGKTTLCSLIPRFYETTGGKIKLDGVDIKKIKIKSLRENIGIVQQDVYLFAGTVAENIRYGKRGATDDEIVEAAKNANAHEFIMNLPDGYDSYIGQRGVKLSGGQKQRLSIARVFLKNPPVLIFDEATSSLDNESEKIVQDSFEKLAVNRTTIVIAHRLSTIKNARRILVLTEDGISEEGSHAELIEMNGVYAGLYNMQFA